MQRLKHENTKIVNEKVSDWAKAHGIHLSHAARSELMEIIDHNANRIALQKQSLASESFSGTFRNLFQRK